jgi:acrylyl-CoA reductase (NADPH)
MKALVLREAAGKVAGAIEEVPESQLPPGEVTVAVQYSTLNYKDGLILGGLGRLVRQYPHVPGVDFVGTVEASDAPQWKKGDAVILTGWRVGETQWGGYAQKARVRGDWLVPLPAGLEPKNAMAIGTAGLTAMLAVMALERHGLTPANGEILVTGAAGGLGSVATAILAKLGYAVAASTGRVALHDYLTSLGATVIIDRATIAQPSGKPLDPERWAACIDSVGGATLAAILPQLKYRGAVASCGLAGGSKLETTVIPFLLRGVSILGIDSVACPTPERKQAWGRLVQDLPRGRLDAMVHTVGMSELLRLAPEILAGQVRGRVVVDVNR